MKRFNFRISASLKKEMDQILNRDEVAARGRSLWITEAFYHLLLEDKNLEKVGVGDRSEEQDVKLTWDASYTTQAKFNEALSKVRRMDPLLEGARSALIRAAIRHMVNR